jgi:hypothetical protein
LPDPPAQLDALQSPVRATDWRFEKTVAFAGGVGRADAAVPEVVVAVPVEPPVVAGVVVAEDVGDEEAGLLGVEEPEEAGLLGVEEPEADAAVSADDAGSFCARGLPPQPAKYIDNANVKPTRMLRSTALLNRDLLRSSGLAEGTNSFTFATSGHTSRSSQACALACAVIACKLFLGEIEQSCRLEESCHTRPARGHTGRTSRMRGACMARPPRHPHTVCVVQCQ